jgi:hypothetical protein
MKDLMALALVRRMLLELGYTVQPDAAVDHIGALEVWLHEPVDELGGLSPMGVLKELDGSARLRDHLRARLVTSTARELR